MNDKKTITAAIGLGAMAGIRTMSAPALLSHLWSKEPNEQIRNSKLEFVQSKAFANTLKFLAGGEMLGDKIPGIPNRISAPILGGRILSGALVGSAIYVYAKEKFWKGALAGGTAALASAYITFYLRKGISESTKLPDFMLGIFEEIMLTRLGNQITKAL